MQIPTKEVDKTFEEILQDLPVEIIEMAYEFKAFARSRKIKTVEELLRVVFLYSGLDKSLREVAGKFDFNFRRNNRYSNSKKIRSL